MNFSAFPIDARPAPVYNVTIVNREAGRVVLKKTYITKMPDQSGAFMEASRAISAAGANITRVSYNKAIDTHTLFIDVSGDEAQLQAVSEALQRIGYIQNEGDAPRVILMEFVLRDVPGAVLPVLELLHRYRFNISYISSHENGTPYQNFRMGLFIEHPQDVRRFLEEAAPLCEIRIIDYDESERVLDNTVFYLAFANRMARKLNLSRRKANELIAQSNRLMQMLDERDESPYKTFDYIGRFADMLAQHRGAAFQPRVSRMPLSSGGYLYCVEPPCGSNSWIFARGGRLLFIDSGFALYAPEMVALLRKLFPGFDALPRKIAISHPDMDHCGLLNLFDEIYVCPLARAHFEMELRGEPNFRERNPAHAPYCAISRILSGYLPPEESHLVSVGRAPDAGELLPRIGSFEFEGLKFDLYQGNGGHATGEVALVCEAESLVFSGDIVVNISGFTREQAAFNRLAPYLMTSVNMDSRRASQERDALTERFSPGAYIYCCGHGAIWDRRGALPAQIEILE